MSACQHCAEKDRRIVELESETCVLRDSAAEMVKSIIDADGDDIPVTVAQFETLTKRRDGQRYLHKVSSLLEHAKTHQELFEDVCRVAAKDKERVAVLEKFVRPLSVAWENRTYGMLVLSTVCRNAHDALEGRS